jgi:hypothetical protein
MPRHPDHFPGIIVVTRPEDLKEVLEAALAVSEQTQEPAPPAQYLRLASPPERAA